jgi:hypothetical protein
VEQQAARKEYETFSKKLDPEVKSYFDRIMDSVGDFCHQFNDFIQRASEITDMYLHLDDNLTDEFQRHEIKEAIINREIREKRNNWLEIAETGLRSLELTAIAGTAKVMTNAAREMQLVGMLVERPTPRQSELFVGEMLGSKARPQISFSAGKEVSYGAKGSVRPDFVLGNACYEVKNYNLTTNVSGLVNDLTAQIKQRAVELPKGMHQLIRIDTRGQMVNDETQRSIVKSIVEKNGGIISPEFIEFF